MPPDVIQTYRQMCAEMRPRVLETLKLEEEEKQMKHMENQVADTAFCVHDSGHSISTTFPVLLDKPSREATQRSRNERQHRERESCQKETMNIAKDLFH